MNTRTQYSFSLHVWNVCIHANHYDFGIQYNTVIYNALKVEDRI